MQRASTKRSPTRRSDGAPWSGMQPPACRSGQTSAPPCTTCTATRLRPFAGASRSCCCESRCRKRRPSGAPTRTPPACVRRATVAEPPASQPPAGRRVALTGAEELPVVCFDDLVSTHSGVCAHTVRVGLAGAPDSSMSIERCVSERTVRAPRPRARRRAPMRVAQLLLRCRTGECGGAEGLGRAPVACRRRSALCARGASPPHPFTPQPL
jgi:hypothetical protein